MYYFLLTLIVITSILLMIIILMQASKGGGLSGAFGAMAQSDLSIGTRQAANFLHKATSTLVTAFLLLTVLLLVVDSPRSDGPVSITQKKMSDWDSNALPGIPAVEPLENGVLPEPTAEEPAATTAKPAETTE